jgi:hypothetical protein
VAYSVLAEGLDSKELDELDIAIGMVEDPADKAIEALRAHQEAQGMEWDDTPVPAPPGEDTLGPW